MGVGRAARLAEHTKKTSDLDDLHKSDSAQKDSRLGLLNEKVNQMQALLGNEETAKTMESEPVKGSPEEKEQPGEAKANEESLITEVSNEVDGMLAEVKETQSQSQTSARREIRSREVPGQTEQSDREQLAQADAGQRALQNESFVPVIGTAKKQSRIGKFFRGLGHILYSGIVALTTPIGYLIGRIVRLFGRRKAQQQSRIQRLIPGSIEREQFPEYQINEADPNQKIENDSRRIPLVWEQKIPENPDQPPQISLMIDQPKEGSANSMNGSEMGHAMVGLFYSRLNRYSGKMERYRLKYGFYPKGGFVNGTATYTMLMSGMLVPGQLIDDRDHPYSVARTFEITNEKVNQVLRMSENYAQGGYGYFKRNCTTFARDSAEEAKVNAGTIFEETDVNVSTNPGLTALLTGGLLGAGLANSGMNEGMLNHIYNKSKVKDLSYAGFGQMMATTDDIERASKSRSLNERMRGLAPGIAGENIRFGAGAELNSMGYQPGDSFARDLERQGTIRNYLKTETEKLCDALKKRGIQDAVIEEIRGAMTEKNTLVSASYDHLLDGQTSSLLREATGQFDAYQKYLNEIYRTQLGQDAELNVPFQHMFAVLQQYKQVLYDLYITVEDELDYERDTARYLNNLSNQRLLKFKKKEEAGPKRTDGKTAAAEKAESGPASVKASAVEQAALIQQFGSLKAGTEFLRKYSGLTKKKERTKKEEREFAKLGRLAGTYLDFKNAQSSYVNRENFTQGDMNLAFIHLPKGLEEVEANENEKKWMASTVYQALAYEKVFGGMKTAYMDHLQQSGVKERKDLDTPGVKENLEEWNFQYLYENASAHQQPMQMIVNAFCQRMSGAKEGDIVREILRSIGSVYLSQILDAASLDQKVPKLEELIKTGTVGRLADLLARMVQTYQEGQAASA